MWGVIPIRGTDGPKALLRSLDAAKEALEEGDLVCIFAEGGITRTGQLQPFQRGLLRIVDGTGCPVIPVYLDELWGSIFSYSGGKFFWKMPRHWPYPISILFGKPLDDPDDINQVRQAVQTLGVEAVEARKDRILVPQRQAIRRLKKCMFRPKVADSSGTELMGGTAAGREPDPSRAALARCDRRRREDGRDFTSARGGKRGCQSGCVDDAAGGGQLELHAVEPGRQSLHPRGRASST